MFNLIINIIKTLLIIFTLFCILLIPSLFAFLYLQYGFDFWLLFIANVIWHFLLVWFIEKSEQKPLEKYSKPEYVGYGRTHLPDGEPIEWMNEALRKMWPFVKKHLEDDINNKIVLPNALKFNFVMETFDLGFLPPRIISMKNFEVEEDNRIVFDLFLEFKSCSVVKVKLNYVEFVTQFLPNLIQKFKKLSKQIIRLGRPENASNAEKFRSLEVKDFALKGVLRIEMRHLIARPPFVGTISFSFLRDPEFDFSLDIDFVPESFEILPYVKSCFRDQIRGMISEYVEPKKFNLEIVNPELDPLFSMMFTKFQKSQKS